VWFCTDTAMTIQIYLAGFNTNYTAMKIGLLGNTGSGYSTPSSGLIAAIPGGWAPMWPLQLPANFAGEILSPAWFTTPGQNALVVATPQVAANCTAVFKWAEIAT